MIKAIIKREQGFTLVENMIALALITAVIIPSSMFMVKLAHNQKSCDMSTATQLCKTTVECTIANEDYLPKQWQKAVNSREWLIQREIEIEDHLIHIFVMAKPVNRENWINRLYLCRYQN